MVIRADAFHINIIVDQVERAVLANVGLPIIPEVVGAYCAILSIEVRVRCWAKTTCPFVDIINLLFWAVFAFHVSIVPVLRMLTFYTDLVIPIQVLGLIASTSL